jgi:hypothetical protein
VRAPTPTRRRRVPRPRRDRDVRVWRVAYARASHSCGQSVTLVTNPLHLWPTRYTCGHSGLPCATCVACVTCVMCGQAEHPPPRKLLPPLPSPPPSSRHDETATPQALANKILMWLMIVMLSLGILLLMYLELFGTGGGGGGGGNKTRVLRLLDERSGRL